MRKSLIIFILASIFLLSIVECKKQLRTQNQEENKKGIPLLMQSGIKMDTSAATPTYYTKSNTACFQACEASGGNSFNYYQYSRYLCCDLGLTGQGNGWYNMYCYALVLNCQGN
ncbi:hypothetical protein ABPG74_008740 [Tetrahymena malaccensis]